jgi:hypothetical protein
VINVLTERLLRSEFKGLMDAHTGSDSALASDGVGQCPSTNYGVEMKQIQIILAVLRRPTD